MQSLARVPFFKDAGVDLEKFDRRCAWRKFDENEIVVDFEDPSTDVYFLLSGEVRVLIRTQSGKEIILAEMRGGCLSQGEAGASCDRFIRHSILVILVIMWGLKTDR